MVSALALVIGAIAGFVGSRALRRPQRAATAASVARSVGSTLGTRKGLTGPELQRACFSEMMRHCRVTPQGATHVPSSFLLAMHPADLAIVDEARRWFTDGLSDALGQSARDHAWDLSGPISIDYRADPRRHRGAPTATVGAPGGGGAKPVPVPPTPNRGGGGLVITRSDTGEQVVLGSEPVTIGRSRDQTVSIDDSRVSRSHARIEQRGGGWALRDESSANGTRVGGEKLPAGRPCPLQAGDVITLGDFELRVTAAPAVASPAGTRALDDQDRTRISSEVFPPGQDDDR